MCSVACRTTCKSDSLLPAEGSRVDYLLPRSDSLAYAIPWKISVPIHSRIPIATAYSPGHQTRTRRSSPHEVAVFLSERSHRDPGHFRLSYLRQEEGMSASLFTYPDADGRGGYFLLLAGIPVQPAWRSDRPSIKREVTLVIDRSGRMGGAKIDQALGQPASDDMLPIMLFLTDGLPTVGETFEAAIRDLAIAANPHERRVFTFGVGVDVNTPLLDKIASASRAKATFVLPGEEVEVKVGSVFERLAGPLLATPQIVVVWPRSTRT